MQKLWATVRWPIIIATVLAIIMEGFQINSEMGDAKPFKLVDQIQNFGMFFGIALALIVFYKIYSAVMDRGAKDSQALVDKINK